MMYRTELIFGNGKQARKKASLGKVKVGRSHHGQNIHINRSIHSHDELLSAVNSYGIFLFVTLALSIDEVNYHISQTKACFFVAFLHLHSKNVILSLFKNMALGTMVFHVREISAVP